MLDGEGEVYVEFEEDQFSWYSWYSGAPKSLRDQGVLAVRAPGIRDAEGRAATVRDAAGREVIGRELTGSLYVPKTDSTGMVRLRFVIKASKAQKEGDEFYQAKENYYEALLDRDMPGGAWFRHQLRLARIARGDDPDGWGAAGR